MKGIKTVPAQSANFQLLAPFHPEQVEGSLPITWDSTNDRNGLNGCNVFNNSIT